MGERYDSDGNRLITLSEWSTSGEMPGGVTRSSLTVRGWPSIYSDFPAAVDRIGHIAIFRLDEINAWFAARQEKIGKA